MNNFKLALLLVASCGVASNIFSMQDRDEYKETDSQVGSAPITTLKKNSGPEQFWGNNDEVARAIAAYEEEEEKKKEEPIKKGWFKLDQFYTKPQKTVDLVKAFGKPKSTPPSDGSGDEKGFEDLNPSGNPEPFINQSGSNNDEEGSLTPRPKKVMRSNSLNNRRFEPPAGVYEDDGEIMPIPTVRDGATATEDLDEDDGEIMPIPDWVHNAQENRDSGRPQSPGWFQSMKQNVSFVYKHWTTSEPTISDELQTSSRLSQHKGKIALGSAVVAAAIVAGFIAKSRSNGVEELSDGNESSNSNDSALSEEQQIVELNMFELEGLEEIVDNGIDYRAIYAGCSMYRVPLLKLCEMLNFNVSERIALNNALINDEFEPALKKLALNADQKRLADVVLEKYLENKRAWNNN